jgi:type IV secretory pathway TraG/TraD family ATPase VirD4
MEVIQEEMKVGLEEIEAGQEYIINIIKATMGASREKTAAISSIRSELEVTMQNRVKDVLFSIDQWTRDLRKD